MATKKIHETTPPFTDTNRIVIERRETVAIIEEDPHGERSMLEAAFLAASGAIAYALQGPSSACSLEFTYGDHRFELAATPRVSPRDEHNTTNGIPF